MNGRRIYLTALALALCSALVFGIMLADSKIRAVAYDSRQPAIGAEISEGVISVNFFGMSFSADISAAQKAISALTEMTAAAIPEAGLIKDIIAMITDCCRLLAQSAG